MLEALIPHWANIYKAVLEAFIIPSIHCKWPLNTSSCCSIFIWIPTLSFIRKLRMMRLIPIFDEVFRNVVEWKNSQITLKSSGKNSWNFHKQFHHLIQSYESVTISRKISEILFKWNYVISEISSIHRKSQRFTSKIPSYASDDSWIVI